AAMAGSARRPRLERPGSEVDREAVAARIGGGAPAGDEARAAEVVMHVRPAADGAAASLELPQRLLVDARLGVDRPARRMEARPVDRFLRHEALVEDTGGHRAQRRP